MEPTLRLRPVRPEDAEAMAAVLADPALYAHTGGEPPTAEELRRRYALQTRGQSPSGAERWINELVLLGPEQLPVGYVQATLPVHGTIAELAWVIGAPWQGRGLASRAAGLLAQRLAGEGTTELIAHIGPGHTASEAVARRIGLAPTDTVVDGEVRWAGPAPEAPPRSPAPEGKEHP